MTKSKIDEAFDEAQKPVTVDRWIAYEEADGMPESVGGLGGCVQFGMRWGDVFTSGDSHLNALRAEIIRLNLRQGGDWHQEDPHGVPVFSDGTVAKFSYRAWGDLLAVTWASHEDVDYRYMDFYMGEGPTAEDARKRMPGISQQVMEEKKSLAEFLAGMERAKKILE